MTVLTSDKTYIGAGIILMSLDKGQRYLLLKGRESGVWSFSKGHPEDVDCGAPLKTAVRETQEETGLRAGADYNIIGNSIRFGKRPYWIGVVKNSEATICMSEREHSEATWFTWEEIVELNTNTDVRCWIKKSRGQNGEFMRLTDYIVSSRKHDTRLTATGHNVS